MIDESTEDQWRQLALQFDRHRMMAMALIKAVSLGQADERDCALFAAAPPVSADQTTKDALRYCKLRNWMSSNTPEGWEKVVELGTVASWVGWDAMDRHLDDLPECNVGLCQKAVKP